MSTGSGTGTGKRPAPTRGQARYARRDVSSERPASRTPGSGSPRSLTPAPSARAPGPLVAPPVQEKINRRRPTGPSPVETPARRPPPPPGRGGGDLAAKARNGAVAEPAPASASPSASASASARGRTRRGLFAWRRPNRRITVESRSPLLWLAEQLAALGRRLLIVGKVVAALAVLAAAVAAGRLVVKHVVASPRFALREVRVVPTTYVTRDEIVALSTVELGDRLLALDTDVIAARLARHPWIAAARVRRELPSALVIDVTERQPTAVAVIGGLYLLDEQGHPFKHATLAEADGHVVVTGISRAEFAALPEVSEAAFREALALLDAYQHPDSLAAARRGERPGGEGGKRPPLSEIHIDPRTGFSLFLYDGGGEIRLGRDGFPDKLARLDEIFAEFGPRGISAVKVVHLDGPASDRVPIRLAPRPPATPGDPMNNAR